MARKNVITRSRKNRVQKLLGDNRLTEAHQLCTQICNSDRTDFEAWTLLGLTERKLGRIAQAQRAARQAIQINPGYAMAHKILGTALQLQGLIEEAINSYQCSLKLRDDDAETCYLLGNALRETGALIEADKAYSKAIKLKPDFVEALCNYGATLTTMARYDEARVHLNKANSIRPGLPQVLCNIALLNASQGKSQSAEKICHDILDKDPDFIHAIEIIAGLHEKANHYTEARQWTDRGLAINPDNVSLNLIAALVDVHDGNIDVAIDRLEKLRIRLPEILQQDILIQLGMLYEKQKDAEKAFQCLSLGNRLKEKTMLAEVKESQHYLTRIEAMRKQFHKDNPANWQKYPDDDFDDNPVFLFGFPRSGTTLLEQILDSHPRLQALPEIPAISKIDRMIKGRPLSELSLEEIQKLRKDYFNEMGTHVKREPGKILVDKNPLNTVKIDLIWRLFPDAKHVLAIRHPCDVVLSCFMQTIFIHESLSTFFTLERTAEAYTGVMSLWQDYIDVLPIDYHRIRYEDLIMDQAGETKRLLDFLGLEWDDNVMHQDEHARKRHINTPSYNQVTKPIYQDAKYRWKRYEQYMRSAIDILHPYIEYFDYSEEAPVQSSINQG